MANIRTLLYSGFAGFIAAIPPAWLLGDMQPLAMTLWALLAGISTSLWLWLLFRFGFAKSLSFVVGATTGLLALASVVVVFAALAPNKAIEWRLFFVGFTIVWFGLYAAITGGLLAILVRGLLIPNSPNPSFEEGRAEGGAPLN